MAAEALERIGNKSAVSALLTAADEANDRTLEHSLIFALIGIADAAGTRGRINSGNAQQRRTALIALDQMEGGTLEAGDVVPLLSSSDATLKETADWIVDRHRDWAAALVPWFREQIGRIDSLSAEESDALQARLARFALLLRDECERWRHDQDHGEHELGLRVQSGNLPHGLLRR